MTVSIEELDEIEQSGPDGGRGEGLPRVAISTAVQTLVAAYQDGMNPSLSQVAARLGQTVNSGAFRNRMASCNHYGMTERAGSGSIRITELGRRLLDEPTRDKAMVEAWMRIHVFAAIFRLYDGTKLPASSALDADLTRMGVPTKQVVTVRRLLMSGAETAGLLNPARERMVMPSFPDAEPDEQAPQSAPVRDAGAALSKTAVLADLGRITLSVELRWLELPELIREKVFAMVDQLTDLEKLAESTERRSGPRDRVRGDAPILVADAAEQPSDDAPSHR
ncbi:hypothetical protein ACFVJ5_06965 [Nocardia sp. NPDC127606]|uniref:hypothetical protein n=1 Tax=Nocardia sp. NPDC127606 TaxID=3345406 RepID=UPI00362FFB09